MVFHNILKTEKVIIFPLWIRPGMSNFRVKENIFQPEWNARELLLNKPMFGTIVLALYMN